MASRTIQMILADDDKDDCYLFEEALNELQLSTQLTTVPDGEQLLELLTEKIEELPDVIFLDLNMPVRNGMECLSEMKKNERFKKLCVIIFSTSYIQEITDLLYKKGAMHYIKKPGNFAELRELIRKAVTIINGSKSADPDGDCKQPIESKFVLS